LLFKIQIKKEKRKIRKSSHVIFHPSPLSRPQHPQTQILLSDFKPTCSSSWVATTELASFMVELLCFSTLHAGVIAGLNVRRIINEPTAATIQLNCGPQLETPTLEAGTSTIYWWITSFRNSKGGKGRTLVEITSPIMA